MKIYIFWSMFMVVIVVVVIGFVVVQIILKVLSFLLFNNVWQKELEVWGVELKEKLKGELMLEIFLVGQFGLLNCQFEMVVNKIVDMVVVFYSMIFGCFFVMEIVGLLLIFLVVGKISEIMFRCLMELVL